MRTSKLSNAIATAWTMALLAIPTLSLAQFYPRQYEVKPGDQSVVTDDHYLYKELQNVSQAIGNSKWWDGLSEKAKSAIMQKMEALDGNVTYADLDKISQIGWDDIQASRQFETDGRSVCPVGDVILTNQNEVDAFGAMGCTEVTGNLIIDDAAGAPKITDLTPLSSLTSVGGMLDIINTTQLTSLDGLHNVEDVDYLHITNNTALADLDGLSGLTTVDGPLLGPCSCDPSQNRINDNPVLADISGLSNLTTIASGFFLSTNAALPSIHGLENLSTLGGALAIENHPNLGSLQSFSSLTEVVRDLVIRNNPSLHNFNGLQNLGSVGSWVIIDDNDHVKNMEGLSGLTSIGGRFLVVNNGAIKNLDGLSSLSHVGEIVWVESNAVIKNLEGLSNLTSAGGVYVYFNPLIKNIDGIEGLTSLENGGLDIWNNPTLKDVSGMSNITHADRLIFEGLPELKNVDAASNVTWVGFDCGVVSCPLVKNIDGFSNITYVGFALGVINLASLENLDGLSHVTWVGDAGLFVIENPSLTSCCGIYQLLCADPPACTDDAIGGPAIVFDNPLGCNSPAEIIAGGPCPEDALQAPIEMITPDIHTTTEVFVYPNPADDRIEIDLGQFGGGQVNIRMVNNLGETLWSRHIQDGGIERHLNISLTSSIPNGLYYLVFVQDSEIVSEPLIIQR